MQQAVSALTPPVLLPLVRSVTHTLKLVSAPPPAAAAPRSVSKYASARGVILGYGFRDPVG